MKKKKRKWTYHGKRIKRETDPLRIIPIKCRRCVWRSNKYVAFCESAKCIWEK